MSVRETPKSNRYLDLKEKERAYKKHMEAVANAKPTIDTSTPDCPNRLRVKEKADAHYRRHLLTDYSKRERMIASAKEGKRNNQDMFPDNYNPDDDEIDFDELVKKYGGDIYQDNPEPKEPPPVKSPEKSPHKTPEKSPHKTEKIHFGDGKVKIEEEDAEEITKNLDEILNDNIDDLTSKKSPSKEKGTPSQKSRASSKIPVPRKTNSSSKNEENSKKEKTNKSSQKVEKKQEKIDTKSGLLGTSKDSFSSSAKKKTLQNTASSTMSFGDDFEDDFENDQSTEEEKDNFDEPASASESESTNKFEEEKNESDDSKSNKSSDSDDDDDTKKKSLSLDETNSSELDKTEPMSNPIAKLAEDKNSDDMPELDFPDF